MSSLSGNAAEVALESELSLLGMEERTIQCPNITIATLDYELLQKNRDILSEEMKVMDKNDSAREKNKHKLFAETGDSVSASSKGANGKSLVSFWHLKKKGVSTAYMTNQKVENEVGAELQHGGQHSGSQGNMLMGCAKVKSPIGQCSASDTVVMATNQNGSEMGAGCSDSVNMNGFFPVAFPSGAKQSVEDSSELKCHNPGASRERGDTLSVIPQSILPNDNYSVSYETKGSTNDHQEEALCLSAEEFSRRYHHRYSSQQHELNEESQESSESGTESALHPSEPMSQTVIGVSHNTSHRYLSRHHSTTQETQIESLNSHYSIAYTSRQNSSSGSGSKRTYFPHQSNKTNISRELSYRSDGETSETQITMQTRAGHAAMKPLHIKRPKLFSMKMLFGHSSDYSVPERPPPDYVKIAFILLLPAMPCALPALFWALKARSLRQNPDRLSEAWQYSHRSFCCCMISLACLAIFLSSFSFIVLLKLSQCDCPSNNLPTTVAPPTSNELPPTVDCKLPDIINILNDRNVMHAKARDDDGEVANYAGDIYDKIRNFTRTPSP